MLQVYYMAYPPATQFPESVMIFALYRYYGQCSELGLKLTLKCRVARFLLVLRWSVQ